MTTAPVAGGGLRRLFWWLTAAIIAADQVTKLLVMAWLPLYDSVTLIDGVISLTHVQNRGVAFGLLNEAPIGLPLKSGLTTALAVLALAGIAYYARHIRVEERAARVGLSLILGGAIGNLIDRIGRGFVVDFVDVAFGSWHFWAFNVADASITIGAVLVFVDLLLVRTHASDSV